MLAVNGQYWRTRRELLAVPGTGTVVQVLDDPELKATVIGSTCPPAGAEERSAAAAVLVRASTSSPGAVGTALRSAGWRQLL